MFFQLQPASIRSGKAACTNSKSNGSFSSPLSTSASPFRLSTPPDDNFDFCLLARPNPETTQSQVTVGMVSGISERDLSDSAFRVLRTPASVTMCVTMAGSYFGTNVPPCFTIYRKHSEYITDRLYPNFLQSDGSQVTPHSDIPCIQP